MIRISLNNFFNLILFLVVPIFGLIRALFSINLYRSRTVSYLIIASFFSLLTVKSTPLGDLYRYIFRFDDINSFYDVQKYTIDYTFGIFVLISKYLGIPFYLFSNFFVFLGLFLLFLAVDILYVRYRWSSLVHIFLILLCIIFFNPISASIGLRSFLALSLFIYSVLLISCGKKTGYLFGFLAVLTHISFAYLFVILLLSKYIKINNLMVVFLSFFAFLASTILVPLIFKYFSIYQGGGYYSSYIESQYIYNSKNEFLSFFINMTCFGILYFIYIFFDKKESDGFLINLRKAINILIVSVFVTASIKTAFGRYIGYVGFLIVFVIFIEYFYYKKNSLAIVALFIVSFIFLSLNNIYYRRDTIINGSFVEMMFISPLFLMNYSDREYRMLLKNVDSDGLIK